MAGPLFINVYDFPDTWKGNLQICFLGAIYVFIVFKGCNFLSDGSELLEQTKWKSLIGPTIIPILGQVPDAAIVLFSGVGSDAQKEMSVGIGALAGSTVMLLTVPLVRAVFGGRIDLSEGKSLLDKDPDEPGTLSATGLWNIFTTGVVFNAKMIRRCGMWMAITLLPYLIIEVPALWFYSADDTVLTEQQSPYAFWAGLFGLSFFVAYLASQNSVENEQIDAETSIESIERIESIEKRGANIRLKLRHEFDQIKSRTNTQGAGDGYGSVAVPLEPSPSSTALAKIKETIKPFFEEYCSPRTGKYKGLHLLNETELRAAFQDLGIRNEAGKLDEMIEKNRS